MSRNGAQRDQRRASLDVAGGTPCAVTHAARVRWTCTGVYTSLNRFSHRPPESAYGSPAIVAWCEARFSGITCIISGALWMRCCRVHAGALDIAHPAEALGANPGYWARNRNNRRSAWRSTDRQRAASEVAAFKHGSAQ